MALVQLNVQVVCIFFIIRNLFLCFKSVADLYYISGYKILQKAKGFHCSTGSACHSGNIKPSKILIAFHIPHNVAANALRLSTGRETSKQDIDMVVAELRSIINSLSV